MRSLESLEPYDDIEELVNAIKERDSAIRERDIHIDKLTKELKEAKELISKYKEEERKKEIGLAWKYCGGGSCKYCKCIELCREKDKAGQKGEALDRWVEAMIEQGEF